MIRRKQLCPPSRAFGPRLNPILEKILATKQEELASVPKFFSQFHLPLYSFYNSLRRSSFPAVIAECKRQSPSAGLLRPDYDPQSIAKIYEEEGAAAISVLTDQTYFGGSLQDLEQVSRAVQIPVLRKDFILDRSQISEARANGASAVLLIVRILSPSTLRDLLNQTHDLGMGALVEVHTAKEVETALEAGAVAIGINTRDLDTFHINPELIPRLAPLIPADRIRIGESGMETPEDWKSLQGIVDGILVGSYFMKHTDIRTAYRNFLGKSSP